MSELLLLANFSSETYVLYPDWHHDDESVDNNDAAADGGIGTTALEDSWYLKNAFASQKAS